MVSLSVPCAVLCRPKIESIETTGVQKEFMSFATAPSGFNPNAKVSKPSRAKLGTSTFELDFFFGIQLFCLQIFFFLVLKIYQAQKSFISY